MSLPPGTRLGPYEVIAPLGEGGMGEVYRARDTRLNRTVAVKVLPADLAADPERRQRFEREARLVASLNHPQICALHDVGDAPADDGSTRAYLVMEYLEGETLADRIARGPLPLHQVAQYGAAIAHALDAAHRQHIVHRDLKPGNIMVTRSGVKLLDFGLAKAAGPASPLHADLTTQVVSGQTMAGTVMGTMPYMAPEQLEGKEADERSDIFALGAVLYEMATGSRAFPGASAAAVTSAIMTAEPPPITGAAALERIVRPCLAKDPEARWRSAHDVALLLERGEVGEPPARRGGVARYAPWLVAAMATAAAIATAVWAAQRSTDDASTTQPAATIAFPLPPPAGWSFTESVEWVPFALSPDGRTVAYSAVGADRVPRLWLRPIDQTAGRPVDGTEGASSLFWSPDSRDLAFFAGGRLKRLELASGRVLPVCEVGEAIGQMGTWGADGQILFATVQGEALLRVSASGGTPSELRRRDEEKGESRITWPTFLPDGRSYLYVSSKRDDTGGVMLASIAGGAPRQILNVKSNVQYADPGYLLFARERSLVAQRFDVSTGELSGDFIPVAEPVVYFRATGLAQFSASRNGVVVFQPKLNESRVAAFERSGRELSSIAGKVEGAQETLSLSADGRRLLTERLDVRFSTLDIWMLDLERGTEQRVTHEPRTDAFPVWGPADTMLFSIASGSAPRLFRRNLSTGEEQELAPRGRGLQHPTSVSHDGQWLFFHQRTPRGTFDLMLQNLVDNTSKPFRATAANEMDARFSPDGRLVAFVSDESGRAEVLLAPFPSGPAVPVSQGGGLTPRWSPDGRELFFIAQDGQLVAVAVRPGSGTDFGKPARLYPARAADGPWGAYVVAPGDRFYATVRTRIGSQSPLTVVVNWPSAVK